MRVNVCNSLFKMMGFNPGAFCNKDGQLSMAGKSSRRHKTFPRHKDATLIPCVVVEIPVGYEGNTEINNGSHYTAYGCCFCPDNDCLLATVSVMRGETVDLEHYDFNRSLPGAGYVTVWNVTEEVDVKCGDGDEVDYFYEESSPTFFTFSPKPCCTFSGDGNLLTVILNCGRESLMIARRHQDSAGDNPSDVWFSETDLKCHGQGSTTLCGRTQCAVLDGCKMVTVSNVSMSSYRNTVHGDTTQYTETINEVCLWNLANPTTGEIKPRSTWKIGCQVICKDFQGSVNQCKFAPNGSILGLSSTNGDCLFLDITTGGLFAWISHTRNSASKRSPSDFDFDPSQDGVVAAVWEKGCMCIFEIHRNSVNEVYRSESPIDKPFSNSIRYSPDGKLLAVGTLSGHVLLFDPENGSCNLILDICQEQRLLELAVFGISFTKSCQEVAVAYMDGTVRIWQLQRVLNLQHICRLEILKNTAGYHLNDLPLPDNLKRYLFFK